MIGLNFSSRAACHEFILFLIALGYEDGLNLLDRPSAKNIRINTSRHTIENWKSTPYVLTANNGLWAPFSLDRVFNIELNAVQTLRGTSDAPAAITGYNWNHTVTTYT